MGYSSDPKREERSVQFEQQGDEWKVKRYYDGDEKAGLKGSLGKEGVRVVRGVSGEAVAILKEPGENS